MRTVSSEWKKQHRGYMLNESYIDIVLEVTNPDIKITHVELNYPHHESREKGVIDGVTPNAFMSLERNCWLLDGSRVPYSDNDVTGAIYGRLDNSIKANLTCRLNKLQDKNIPGITVVWSKALNEYAKKFKLIFYKGSEKVKEVVVADNNKVSSTVFDEFKGFDKFDIQIDEWCLSNRYPRIEQVVLGIKETFTKEDITDYKWEQSVSPIMETLPLTTLNFSINNIEGELNSRQIKGLSKFLIERQKLNVTYGLKLSDNSIERIPGGEVYLSEWKFKPRGITADFQAKNILTFLDEEYIKGTYTGEPRNLYDLAVEILEDSNLPIKGDGSKKYRIDSKLKYITTVSALPIKTKAECLQMIAHASGSILYVDTNGDIVIGDKHNYTSNYTINDFNLFKSPEISLEKPCKGVRTKVYTYAKDSENKDIVKTTLDIRGTQHKVFKFNDITADINVSVSGGSYNNLKKYARACEMDITGSGNVTISITGKKVEVSTFDDYMVNEEKEGVVIDIDNELISSVKHANIVNEYVRNYLSQRNIINEVDWRIDPRIDCLDVVRVNSLDFRERMLVTDLNIEFKGAFHCKAKGRCLDD